MCWQNESLLSKKNLKYHYVSLDQSTGSFKGPRSNGGELIFSVDLEKWKTSDLSCLMTKLNYLKREEIIL